MEYKITPAEKRKKCYSNKKNFLSIYVHNQKFPIIFFL